MDQKAIRVVAEIRACADKRREVEGLLQSLVEPTRREAGCREYRLHVNNQDPSEFVFVEEWEDEQSLNTHLQSPHVRKVLSEVTPLLESLPTIKRCALIA